jgi:acetyl esterase/lipase
LPVAFLIVSIIGALFTLNAFRPLRVEVLAVPIFFAGWLTSELPLHHLAWQVLATAVFIALGALHGTAGQVGLAISVLSWAGLIALAAQASRAEGVLEVALAKGLGEGYRARMSPELRADEGPALAWSRLVLPFRLKDPDVEVMRNIAYQEDGSKAHKLDVYRNRSHPTGSPVLLYLHGGAWVLGDKREQGIPLMLHLAARNWVCVTANYRLSPKATFPDQLVDAKAALAWIRSHITEYGGDPSFVVVAGGSAGGHLTALIGLTANDPAYQPGFEEAETSVAACVPLYGVYDFTNRDGLRGPGMGKWLLERSVMKVSMQADPRAYQLASPMDQVGQHAPPFLVIHGANDTLVPVKEARHFVELLSGSSTSPVVYAELPGAQHAFEIFRSVRTAHLVRAAARFLAVVHGDRRARASEESSHS